jgi:hypothetical protein
VKDSLVAFVRISSHACSEKAMHLLAHFVHVAKGSLVPSIHRAAERRSSRKLSIAPAVGDADAVPGIEEGKNQRIIVKVTGEVYELPEEEVRPGPLFGGVLWAGVLIEPQRFMWLHSLGPRSHSFSPPPSSSPKRQTGQRISIDHS